MDPNATLAEIDAFLKAHETGTDVDEWCEDLHGWLSIGGFDPEWSSYPLGTSYYKCRCVYMDKTDYIPISWR